MNEPTRSPPTQKPRKTAPKQRRKATPKGAPSAQEELEVLIRARYPIIYVTSWEEERVERCLRDARMWTMPDGTTQIQQLVIGRELLGMSAVR